MQKRVTANEYEHSNSWCLRRSILVIVGRNQESSAMAAVANVPFIMMNAECTAITSADENCAGSTISHSRNPLPHRDWLLHFRALLLQIASTNELATHLHFRRTSCSSCTAISSLEGEWTLQNWPTVGLSGGSPSRETSTIIGTGVFYQIDLARSCMSCAQHLSSDVLLEPSSRTVACCRPSLPIKSFRL